MKENNYGWDNVPPENSDAYIEACRRLSSDDFFSSFRRDPDYGRILSGDPKVVGDIAIRSIISMNEIKSLVSNLDSLKQSDEIGNPFLYQYGNLGFINPSTLKYFNTSLEIKNKLSHCSPKNVLEIGGGYGGLAKIFNILHNYENYTIIDLPESINLAKKFLNHFDSIKNKIGYITCDNLIDYEKNIDLFISDSCIAECGQSTQTLYFEKYVQKSKFIFITWNTLHLNQGRKEFDNFLSMCSRVGFKGNIEMNTEGIAHLFFEKK